MNCKDEMIRVRELVLEKDLKAVEDMERRCEVGPSADTANAAAKKTKKKKRSVSLYVDLLGDPLSRVRHAPEHVMMVVLLSDFFETLLDFLRRHL